MEETKPAEPTYESVGDAHFTFRKIGMFEAKGGDVILRGRHGERDHLIPLDSALSMYYSRIAYMNKVAQYNVLAGGELKDICDEFRARICEAVDQRKKENREVPQEVQRFYDEVTAVKKITV